VCWSGDKWIFGQKLGVPARLNNHPRITGSFGSFKDDRSGIGHFCCSASGLNPFAMPSQSDVSPAWFSFKTCLVCNLGNFGYDRSVSETGEQASALIYSKPPCTSLPQHIASVSFTLPIFHLPYRRRHFQSFSKIMLLKFSVQLRYHM
jgi:hypothetical protein